MSEVEEVLSGGREWSVACARWEDFLPSLPDDSADLVFGSPLPRQGRDAAGRAVHYRGIAWTMKS